MFGPLVRATKAFVVGAMLFVPLTLVGDEFLALLNDNAPAASTNADYLGIVVTWWPAIVLAAIVVILIAGAVARRDRGVIR